MSTYIGPKREHINLRLAMLKVSFLYANLISAEVSPYVPMTYAYAQSIRANDVLPPRPCGARVNAPPTFGAVIPVQTLICV